MAQDTDRFRCPCCHKQLELDRATGRVREVAAEAEAPKRAGEDMDALIAKQTDESERIGDAFARATKDALHQADKFDELFDSALEQAKKDKDKKSRNPFDLD